MGWLTSLKQKAQQRKWEREQEKRRLQQLEEEKVRREAEEMNRYAQWYMQGIRSFLNDLEREGFHPTGGFESYPYIDYERPLDCFLTKEGDLSLFDFTQVRGVALDDNSKRLLLYKIHGKKRSAFLNGVSAPQNLVSYKMFDYDTIVGATYSPFYTYKTISDNSEAMATAIAGGVFDGLTGGKLGAYATLRSSATPISVTNRELNRVQLDIETTEPGYKHILFQGTYIKCAYSRLVDCYSPIADTIFRGYSEGVFSKTPYYVEDRIVNRQNGTKKDYMFGLGPYVYPSTLESFRRCYAPVAQIGALSGYLEQFAEQINNSIRRFGCGFSRAGNGDITWREFCEDGSEYGVFPRNYKTLREYYEALEEAKYGWRNRCEDGRKFGILPENYDTAEEYEEALEEAKYEWRNYCEDGIEFGIDPEDYETEEEYEEALEEAKYEWRNYCEDGIEFGIDPEDYETEDEYNEALEAAKYEASGDLLLP